MSGPPVHDAGRHGVPAARGISLALAESVARPRCAASVAAPHARARRWLSAMLAVADQSWRAQHVEPLLRALGAEVQS